MRSRPGAGGRHGRGQGSSASKLLVLVLASTCLVFAYMYIYSAPGGPIVRRQALSAIRIRSGSSAAGGELHTQQGDPSTAHETVRVIAKDDPQHPNNQQQVISQQSHGEEQNQQALDTLKQQQQSDGNEQQQQQQQQQASGATSGSASTPGAQNAAKAGGAASTGAAGSATVNSVATSGSAGSDATGTGSTGAAASGASPADESHDIDSGVQATAASLKHATEHLKQATELLAKQAAEGKVVVLKTADGTVTTNTTDAAAAAGNGTGAAASGAAAAGSPAASPAAAAETTTAAAAVTTTTADASPNTSTATAATTAASPAAAAATITATTTTTTTVADAASASPATVSSPAAAAGGESAGQVAASTPSPDLLAYSKAQGHPGETIHVLFTSNGSPYQNIQARVMVGTFNLVRKMPGGEKLVAITRILHRTTPDEVMDEIPTFRANPLQPECDKWCWFPVADRANAVQQWIDAAHKDPSMVKAPWLLMLETDYVWMKPLLARGSAYDPQVPGLAFRFDYIAPQNPTVAQILAEKCPTCDPATVPGSGPAPVLMRFSDLRAATPLWEDLSQWIETHPEAKKTLGWVREMYAWDIGVAANRLNILTESTGTTTLISQPPHDHSLYNATMFHYTWGCIVKNGKGEEVWKFDKRFYTEYNDALKLPTFVEPPPWTDGLHVHDGTPWSRDLRDTMLDMIAQMNKAVATLPNLLEKQEKAAATTTA